MDSNEKINEGKSAIFAGSFNPFTKGHASIVERALELFDKLYVVVGVNAEKKPSAGATQQVEHIQRLYSNEPRVEVLLWDGLMADLARRKNVRFFVRGVRNVSDFEYERNMADVNRRIAGIETVFLPALPELGYINSSVVRELQNYGVDVSDMMP